MFISIFLKNKQSKMGKFLFIFLFCFLLVNTKNSQAALNVDENIKQVKYPNSSTVYYLNHRQKIKKAYVSPEAFLSYGNKWSDVKVLDAAYLDLWKSAEVVRVKGDPSVYFIKDGKKKIIKSGAEFLGLGYQWGQVMEISTFDLAQYTDISGGANIINKTNEINISSKNLANNGLKIAISTIAKKETKNKVVELVTSKDIAKTDTVVANKTNTTVSAVNKNNTTTKSESNATTVSSGKIVTEKKINSEIVLSWPIRGHVNFGFHDPDYLYNFVHEGIDIATSQGTSVRAAQNGTVLEVLDGGLSGYSYVAVDHGNGYKTVYGHLSKINVTVGQKVTTSTIIARSGGKPGTSGAGQYSNGPHLHFELLKNGVHLDPELYLP